MPAIGITGGIATGKTTFRDCLRELVPDAAFFDADKAAHDLVELDQDVKSEVAREFGAAVFSNAGDLNREQLRAIVFASPGKRRALEKILHPRIRSRWSADAKTHLNSPDFFFADIPLLYETDGETLCDRVVVVACSPELQFSRLRERTGIERAEADKIINSQMSLSEKMKRGNHVVWNDGDRALLKAQAKLLVDLWGTETWTKK